MVYRIYVEGHTDADFIHHLLLIQKPTTWRAQSGYKLQCTSANHSVEIIRVNGFANLQSDNTIFADKRGEGVQILVIFDADSPHAADKSLTNGGYRNRHAYIETKLKDIQSQFPSNFYSQLEAKIFLFPNNQDNGDLETLLSQLFTPKGKDYITDCWKPFNQSVKNHKHSFNLPTQKSLVKECAAAIDSHVWDNKGFTHSFSNPDIWNFNSPALAPLLNFLQTNIPF